MSAGRITYNLFNWVEYRLQYARLGQTLLLEMTEGMLIYVPNEPTQSRTGNDNML